MIETLRRDIESLAAAAAPLEPDAAARASLVRRAAAHAEEFWESLAEAPSNRGWDAVFESPLDPEFSEQGRDPAEIFAFIGRTVDQPGITTASPRFMGYIPGGGLIHSAVGDFLAAASNKYSGFASAAPGAARLENAAVAWLAGVVGFPEGSAGTLTSGGSMANLTAIVAAREARDSAGGGSVYMSASAHHCIDKGLRIADRAKAPRRLIPLDDRHRMRADALADALAADRKAGIRPWLVIASAGTVDTGSVDPLDRIADICQKHGAWLHVDGAYGGLFMLCEEGRAALGGIERADSLALDPHKTLFLPYGTGAVLVREGRLLFDAFSASADYIQPLGESGVGPSPADLSPELTRHFRGLRLWLPIQLAGIAAFRAAQSENIGLARYFHARLSELADWDPGPAPDLSVVAFRHRADGRDRDLFNDKLLRRIQEEGRVFLSGTRIGGESWLRCAILSFRTHLAQIDETVDVLVRAAAVLQSNGGNDCAE